MKIINPSNGEIIKEIPASTESEVKAAIATARDAFDFGPWLKLDLDERKNYLLEISEGILERAQDLANLETQNTGKPIKESIFMDIPSAAESFKYFALNLNNFLEPKEISLSSSFAEVQASLWREPLGVVVLIVPWNYPLLIASWKIAAALAAGNTVVLKPSSLTPLTAIELVKIIESTGIPKGVVNIVLGSGEEAGKMLCADKRVDLISFTGSNASGKKIIEYTGENVKKLIMELGGKSASIILADADLQEAVNGSLCSIFLNQGQMCTAMSRIFVEDDIYNEFVDGFLARAKQIKLGPADNYETQMGPLISNEQRQKVLSFVENAKREGAQLLYGGKIPDAPELKRGFF
ncbi:MAG: aldehyde dehydrogenase family protein, partial [Candidatus Omnitrophica bacterium]|nr:aldehyde dehydrogenase family protein [Candidatus Omnitrophota bacterium]